MSLSVFNPLSDQQFRIDELLRKLRASEEARTKIENDLRSERTRNAVVDEGLSELRAILTPLYQGIGKILGEIRVMGVAESTVSSSPRNSAVWDSWKQKMGPNSAAATIIDLLMLHGELTQEQMRIHIGTKRMQTVYDACSKLNKAQLVNKNGDKFSLKEL